MPQPAIFDTFLFDASLFDSPGTPPGSFYTPTLVRIEWTAAVNAGTDAVEACPNPAGR